MKDDTYYEWDHRILGIYREVIGDSASDGTDRTEAIDIAMERIRPLVDSGDLKIPVDTAIRSTLLRVDDQDSGAAGRVLAKIVRGEEAFDMDSDPAMEMVVALGGGRRKTLRHVNGEDLIAMDELRYKNLRSAQDAYAEWRDVFDRVRTAVLRFGTVGDAHDHGAFA